MDLLKLAFRISRVRFWLYLGGTYLAGYAFGVDRIKEFINIEFFFYLFLFMIPANIFLYGVNDLYDTETDEKNPKKGEYEHKLQDNEKKNLNNIVLLSFLFFIGAVIFNFNITELILLVIFIYLSYYYSAKPFRFKARPLLDFSSNALYFIPGLIGYHQAADTLPSIIIIISLFLWTAAMHLFSAVPDIEFDKKVGDMTSAVKLGRKGSLLLCFLFWLGFVIILLTQGFYLYLTIILFIYPLIPLLLIIFPKVNINKVYKIYPYLNAILGLVTFLHIIVLEK